MGKGYKQISIMTLTINSTTNLFVYERQKIQEAYSEPNQTTKM